MRRLGAIALVGAIVLAACGEAEDAVPIPPAPGPVATLADLVGPWQPTPFALDGAWRNTIETTCRREVETPGAARGVIDARGGGVATVRMTGRAAAKCDALRITAAGQIEGAGGGMGGGPEGAPPAQPGRIGVIEEAFIFGGSLTITGWSLTAPVGVGIARVEVESETPRPITASLENGWFSAWWPAPRGDRRPERSQMPAYRVRAYDAAGAVLDER